MDRIGRLLATVAVLAVVFLAWRQSQDRHAAEVRAERLEVSRDALAAQVEQLGGDPVEDASPGDVVVVPGEPGRDGEDGRDGRDCDPLIWPLCQGPQGEQGEQGEPGETPPPGEDGVDGLPGRPPTAEEIADAVAAYCDGGACKGDPGADGAPGADGPAGPPPASFEFSWLTTTWTCTDPDGDGHYACEPA